MSALSLLRERLVTEDSAVLITSELHARYLTGLSFSDGAVLVLPQDAYLLTDFRYAEVAEREVDQKLFQIRVPKGAMKDEIASLLRKGGIGRLFVEEGAMSLSSFEAYRSALVGVELLQGATKELSACRERKTAEEIKKMTEAQKLTDEAFSHILTVLSPEMTEIEVALELDWHMRRGGAEGIAFDTIAVSGSASSLPHGVPRNKPLERGFLTLDFGARVDGYCADMTRTVSIGRADEEMKKVYKTVLRAQQCAIEHVAEGASCYEIDRIARKIIEEAGYGDYFGHSLGHGVGVEVHEAPRLSPSASPESRLERGHVVTVEPGIYLPERFGCRIEDMVAILKDGSIYNFTKSPKELIEL